jgi:putative ABC transport system substrate-binding protein
MCNIKGKKIFTALLIAAAVMLNYPSEAQEAKKVFKIGLAVLKDNPDYYVGRTAFIQTLEKQKGMSFEFKLLNAYGDAEVYRAGLQQFVDQDSVDLIFVTGTRSVQPAVEIVKEIPVIFTAVASPVRGGIVKSLEHPGMHNITGTHCGVEALPQLKMIQKVIPSAKTIGIIYTSNEPNAEFQTQDFKSAAKELGLEVLTSVVEKECKTEEEVAEATKELVGKVDVLVAHQDTSLSQYGKGMIRVAEENRIPTYVTLGQLLSEGAMFSLGVDFNELGAMSGEQAVEILKNGIAPDEIPVTTYTKYSLMVNLSAAQKIGFDVPLQILRSASTVIR